MKYLQLIPFLLLVGCVAVTTADLKEDADRSETWHINLPVFEVYKDYKEHAENKYSLHPYFIRSDYYGKNEGAELSIVVEADTLVMVARIVSLHFEFEKDNDGTKVTGWYRIFWNKEIDKFKALHKVLDIK